MQTRRTAPAAPSRVLSAAFTALPLLAFAAAPADAGQSVADFYRGKTVTMAVGTSPGGDYDLRMRMIARHIGKHIPGNPKIVPTNMPGAGGDAGRQLARQCGAQGRHRHRGALAVQGGGPGDRRRGRQIRRAAIQLDRQQQQLAERHQFLAHHRHPHHRGRDAARTGRWRNRHRQRHLLLPLRAQSARRNQVQDRHRLSRRQRHEPRDGTRRAGWARLQFLGVLEVRRDRNGSPRRRFSFWSKSA